MLEPAQEAMQQEVARRLGVTYRDVVERLELICTYDLERLRRRSCQWLIADVTEFLVWRRRGAPGRV